MNPIPIQTKARMIERLVVELLSELYFFKDNPMCIHPQFIPEYDNGVE